MPDRSPTSLSGSAVHDLLRRHGIRLHDSVIAELATAAERDRYREALHVIAADTLDHETAEKALAWRQKLAHKVSS